ncbi:MAG: hypothetical protein ACREQ9_06980, partial [Candidatus Binatia bacterium]
SSPRTCLAVLGLAWLAACAERASKVPQPDPRDVVRIAPPVAGHEEEEEARAPFARLPERFPGIAAVDFVRLLITSEEREGACWSEVSPPWKTRLDVDYAIEGKQASGSGFEQLKSQGWWPTYRAPQGRGIERRAKFSAIDMTVSTEVSCRCAEKDGVAVGESKSFGLRFRWQKGAMPEVSASAAESGRRKGLSPATTFGHFLTYEFRSPSSFPNGAPGSCGAHLILSVLADPPIL